MPPAPGLGVFGSNVEYWSSTLRPRELVVETEAERQRQLVAHLELVVDPGGRVRLVERRLHGDGLLRREHLAEQERRKWVASLPEIVAAGVVAPSVEAIEVELPSDRADRPSARRELMFAVLEPGLDRMSALRPTSGRPRIASDCSLRTRIAARRTARSSCTECCPRSSSGVDQRPVRGCRPDWRPRATAASRRRLTASCRP